MATIVEGLENDFGYLSLMTLNRIEPTWADDEIKAAIHEAKHLFVDESVTMKQGADKLKSVVETLKENDEGTTTEDHE